MKPFSVGAKKSRIPEGPRFTRFFMIMFLCLTLGLAGDSLIPSGATSILAQQSENPARLVTPDGAQPESGRVEAKEAGGGDAAKESDKDDLDTDKLDQEKLRTEKAIPQDGIREEDPRQRRETRAAANTYVPSPEAEHLDKQGYQRLTPDGDVWLDSEGKRVLMIGTVCFREGPLEMFACNDGTKEHESVLSVNTKVFVVHAGLLALGIEPGSPAQWRPEYVPAKGPIIDVGLSWKGTDGVEHKARAQEWVRGARSQKEMSADWVFGGSGFWKDDATGKEYYLAEQGFFICVSNFTAAMLDLPIESTETQGSEMYEAFTDRIPPLGTRVVMSLSLHQQQNEPPKKDSSTQDKSSTPGEQPDPPSKPSNSGERDSSSHGSSKAAGDSQSESHAAAANQHGAVAEQHGPPTAESVTQGNPAVECVRIPSCGQSCHHCKNPAKCCKQSSCCPRATCRRCNTAVRRCAQRGCPRRSRLMHRRARRCCSCR